MDLLMGVQRIGSKRSQCLDQESMELQDEAVSVHMLSGNQPGGEARLVHRVPMREWSFSGDLHQGWLMERDRGPEGSCSFSIETSIDRADIAK